MIGAERVRRTAEEVLERPAYRDLAPDPLARAVTEVRSWIAERLFDLFSGQAAAGVGAVVAVVVVVAVVALGAVALAGVRRRAAADLVVDEPTAPTAAGAETSADEARAAGDLVTAVRRRYGALVLLLVERDVLAQLPGTTVGEVDAAVARAAPACAPAVLAAGRTLADIVYGHRPAREADDDRVAEALRQVRRSVPGGGVGAAAGGRAVRS